jgi:photosystem II stability/assembly factor-like uncharacterized protein
MKKILLGLVGLCALHTNVFAQWWESMGPSGGNVLSYVALNDYTVVGTSCGVYRVSPNDGAFYPHSQGMPAGNIQSMIEDDGVLIASIANKGLYRSVDGGVTWTLSRSGAYQQQGTFGSQNLLRLNDMTVARNTNGDSLYFSSDEGETWSSQYIPINMFNKVMSAGGNLYAYSNALGDGPSVYRSADLGQSWQAVNEGLAVGTFPGDFYTLGETLYLLAGHVYASTDNGLSWTQMTTELFSADFNPSWTLLHEGRFYAQNAGNNNVNITSWMPGEVGWQVYSEIPTQGNFYTFYTVGNVACFSRAENQYRKTSDAWEIFQIYGLNAAVINGIFAADNECFSTTNVEVRRISDTESVWSQNNPPNIPDNGSVLSSIVRVGDNLLLGRSSGILQIMRSADDGATWTAADLYNIAANARFLVSGERVFVYGSLGGEPFVFEANQLGEQVADLGSPFGWSDDQRLPDLVEHEGSLYALPTTATADFAQILKWNLDGGTFWLGNNTTINGEWFGARCITSWQGSLYLGMSDSGDWEGGVLRTDDTGFTWTSVSTGIEDVEVYRFLPSGDSLFAATDAGVYVLTSGSSTWESLTGNLPVSHVIDLARTDWYLYAQLLNGGVWRLSLTDEVSVSDVQIPKPTPVAYPNPSSGELYLRGLELGTYTIAWRDVHGRIIESEHVTDITQPLRTAELASGAYLLEVRRDGFRHTFKVLVN